MTTASLAGNAIHAAATWLQRLGAGTDAAAIVTTHPNASLHVWRPGAEHLATLPSIDDSGAELCEAVAPLVADALQRLDASALEAVHTALKASARLQVLLVPLAGDIMVRIVSGGATVVIATLDVDPPHGASATLH